jgi:hypothetical protein
MPLRFPPNSDSPLPGGKPGLPPPQLSLPEKNYKKKRLDQIAYVGQCGSRQAGGFRSCRLGQAKYPRFRPPRRRSTTGVSVF